MYILEKSITLKLELWTFSHDNPVFKTRGYRIKIITKFYFAHTIMDTTFQFHLADPSVRLDDIAAIQVKQRLTCTALTVI